MRTKVLPNGSIVALVQIRSFRIEKHFLSGKHYVQLELKNGSVRNAVGRVSNAEAETVRQELIGAIQLAYDELSPFDYGYEEGAYRRASGRPSIRFRRRPDRGISGRLFKRPL